MKLLLAGAGLLALLHCAVAWPQAMPHSSHGSAPMKAGDAKPVATPPAAPPTPRTNGSAGYRSPFAGYRPFTPDEPLKDWRAANDEVRDSGGHIGLMKAAKR